MLGIIQEQHPDRCRLFMQWHRMDWPILVDSLNLLDFDRVPFTIAVDEHGIIRHLKLPPDKLESEFLSKTWPAPEGDERDESDETTVPLPDLAAMHTALADSADARRWRDLGDAEFLWGNDAAQFTRAIAAYTRAIELDATDSRARFRRGVTLRRRYDSDTRQANDFGAAVEDWTAALKLTPSNYIWRRRIQQYGPRLDKPYSFYDWVNQARTEIEARGEKPAALSVEPGGAEFAYPTKQFDADAASENPDPDRKLPLDSGRLIAVESAVAPATVKPGESVRVHVMLRPDSTRLAHWDNSAGATTVWINGLDGVPAAQLSARRHELTGPAGEATSTDTRRAEFELIVPADLKPGDYRLTGYALAYVCEDVDGVCNYLRHEFEVSIRVAD